MVSISALVCFSRVTCVYTNGVRKQMTRDKYTVWKIGTNGTYVKLVKDYKTFKGACNRAHREAESQWRSGVKYIVSQGFSDGNLMEGKKASQVGMDGVEYSGNARYEVEV